MHKFTPKNKKPLIVTHEGESLTIMEWAERTGISGCAISKRIKRGWSPEKALTTAHKQTEGKR